MAKGWLQGIRERRARNPLWIQFKKLLIALGAKEPPRAPDPIPPYVPYLDLLRRESAAWRRALASSRGGPKVLVATAVGGTPATVLLESVIGMALTLRGAEVHVLLCDESLPACLRATHQLVPDLAHYASRGPAERLCPSCYRPGLNLYQALGFPVHRISDLVPPQDESWAARTSQQVPREKIAGFLHEGVSIGEHATAGALRYFALGELEGEPHGEAVLRRYLHASLRAYRAICRLQDRERFVASVFNHGIYVPHGIFGEVFRRRGVRVANWQVAYRQQCFIFSLEDTYHRVLLDEPVSHWESLPWNDRLEREILEYLESRRHGTRDWVWFHEKDQKSTASFLAQAGLDDSRPIIGLLTNVIWDAQLHYRANAFPNMMTWIRETIEWFSRRPDLQLLIRVHPAEIRGTVPSRQRAVEEIRKAFPDLPSNIHVVGPETSVSTYELMERCNAVLIYGTKTGVELTSLGIPVIVAGEAWIRNKGLTLDARSPAEYRSLLDRLPLPRRMDEAARRRARMYAYHFFFRRMIPIRALEPTGKSPPFRLAATSLSDLAAERDPGLELICRGILTGEDFVFPAERWVHAC